MSEAKGKGRLWEGAEAGPEEAPGEAKGQGTSKGRPRVKAVERGQMMWRVVKVDRLVEAEHPVRAIWEFVGRLNLSRYEEEIKAVEHEARGKSKAAA